ncbi:hypothetical protein EIN_472890 [Entamoeba invadens IP1]|uniref:EGF-like domain-containing protein n=1 Tax=Entamoeba invadens IP1 TaxID=370355 RepID=A0A0A1U6G8_ENTIV|nr:hypothetical protein EIN_472890 [Entamoeba invadens IP1]ELP89901.1 hypothetical protein EIN_472890 [Entamoeba invadens IP1]|eukprot:XP_004256672.1 hypothetical protein EIN_472890 [Entamoeba invadens IP1]
MNSLLYFTMILMVSSEYTGSYCKTVVGNECTACIANYILQSDKTCVFKRDIGCEAYTSENKCIECADGYMRDAEKKTCIAGDEYCISGVAPQDLTCDSCNLLTNIKDTSCKNCTDQNKGCVDADPDCATCKTCGSGYNLEAGKCVRVPNCAIQDTTEKMKCTKCIYGYYPDTNKNCVLGTLEHCIEYSSKDECDKCEWKFKLVGKKCEYRPFCIKVDNTKCTECLDGYGLKEGNCTNCEKKNCARCNDDATKCTNCAAGYTKVGEDCVKCAVEGCTTCVNGEPNKCDVCDSATGYTKTASSQQCYKCIDKCLQCVEETHATECQKCTSEYGVQNKICGKCGTGCEACNTDLPNECTNCIPTYKLDATNKKCYKCPDNCLTCDSSKPDTCTKCNAGYALNNGACVKCHEGCQTCDSSNSESCLTCNEGYVHNEGKKTCDKCHTSCKTCTAGNSETACESCPSGFYLSKENKCVSCTGQCETFNADTTTAEDKCGECETVCEYTDMGGADNKCVVITHCETFDTTRPGKCVMCEDGYYIDDKYQCQKCDAKCDEQCAKSATECLEIEHIDNCMLFNKDHTCKQCENGYKFDNNLCISVETCSVRNDDYKCIVCKDSIVDDIKYLADSEGHCKDYVPPSEGSVAMVIMMTLFALLFAL